MQQILIFLLIIFGLNSCNQIKKSEDKEATNTIVGISTDKAPSSNKLIANAMLDCFIFKFKTAKQQADTLVKYFGKNQLTTDEKFFCAFPESFKGMENIFGFDENKGAAPLYYYPNVGNMIGYFANLNSISKKIYYEKYINICVDGVWEADNIVEAFGFADRLINDTEAACSSLSKRTDKEIKSVFHFIFDGPHPKNIQNERIYNELFPKLIKQNEKLGKLLKDSYCKIIAEDDGHGH